MTLLTGSTGVLLRSANRSPLGQAFTKDAGNPILTNGAPGSWEDEEVNGEHVFWDLRLEQFVMSYGGYDGSTHGWPPVGGQLIWDFVKGL